METMKIQLMMRRRGELMIMVVLLIQRWIHQGLKSGSLSELGGMFRTGKSGPMGRFENGSVSGLSKI